MKKSKGYFSYEDGFNYGYSAHVKVLRSIIRGLLTYIFSRGKGLSFPIFVGKGVSFYGGTSKLSIGAYSKIEDNCMVQSIARKGIRIGDNVTIGEGSSIRPSGYYGGTVGEGLSVGSRSAIGISSYIGCSGFISIGEDVIIGPDCKMMAENHVFDNPNIPIKEQGVTNKGIQIGSDVWIGANVTILDGVVLGSRVVVAAGAVVTKSFSSGVVIGGVPAKVIKRL